MNMEDESIAYLKYLNEGSQNYFLQNHEDGLNDTIPVEPIFTEIDATGWPTEGFPILLNSTLITEEHVNNNESSDNIELFNKTEVNENTQKSEESEETMTYFSNEGVSSDKSLISTNGLFLSNDVLLKLDGDILAPKEQDTVKVEQNNESVANNATSHVCITYAPVLDNNFESPLSSNLNENGKKSDFDVIQLINIDGTVTTINKQLFNSLQMNTNKDSIPKNFEKLYSEVKAHKCNLCSFLCESLDEIKSHLSSQHSNSFITGNDVINDKDIVGTKMTSILNTNNKMKTKYTMFLCSECKHGYINKENLKQHMITVHRLTYSTDHTTGTDTKTTGEIKTEMKTCSELSAKSIEAMNILKSQQRAMKKIKCSIKGCPLRFANNKLKQRHEDCHVNQEKKQFMCTMCTAKFSIWRICNMHLWKTHNIDLGLFSCPMCNKYKSNTMAAVINHMASHKEDKPYVCSSCGKMYKHFIDLKNHSVVHSNSEENSDTQCEFCERRFSDSKCLKKHIKFVHDKFKPFICNICGHETARKAMLELHYRQHTGDKPHKCPYCDYKTGDHNCLRKHIMRHVGDTKYSCPHCNYQSIQSSAYKMHLATKHPGKEGTYSCSICTYSSVNAASYFSHVKCHELEKKKSAAEKTDKIDNNENGRDDTGSKSCKSNKENLLNDIDDDEIQNGFLNYSHSEEAVDTGGITIPAGVEV